MNDKAEEILEFWFADDGDETSGPRSVWFEKNPEFDEEIRRRFAHEYEQAAAGELDHWLEHPRSALALILLLDQFPRNLFRGQARTFVTDDKALQAARLAVERGFDQEVPRLWRWFFYLPFEHSEDLANQQRSVELFRALGDDPDSAYAADFAVKHLQIIEHFGRFPHRNETLGRSSTPEEHEFLEQPGSSF
jgi:uncharacterized protein (DUF924 family)